MYSTRRMHRYIIKNLFNNNTIIIFYYYTSNTPKLPTAIVWVHNEIKTKESAKQYYVHLFANIQGHIIWAIFHPHIKLCSSIKSFPNMHRYENRLTTLTFVKFVKPQWHQYKDNNNRLTYRPGFIQHLDSPASHGLLRYPPTTAGCSEFGQTTK